MARDWRATHHVLVFVPIVDSRTHERLGIYMRGLPESRHTPVPRAGEALEILPEVFVRVQDICHRNLGASCELWCGDLVTQEDVIDALRAEVFVEVDEYGQPVVPDDPATESSIEDVAPVV